MQSKLLKRDYKPGISFIVGTREGDTIKADGIILHTAFCLSKNVRLIEYGKIEPGIETIYICGHGNKFEKKIGGRRIEEIADLLMKAGYKGKQEIHLAACSANEIYNGKTMVNLLEEELNKRLHRVYSDAIGIIVTLKNKHGITESWLLNCNRVEFKFLQKYQERFLKDKYIFNIRNQWDLYDHYRNSNKIISKYKEKLIKGEIQIKNIHLL